MKRVWCCYTLHTTQTTKCLKRHAATPPEPPRIWRGSNKSNHEHRNMRKFPFNSTKKSGRAESSSYLFLIHILLRLPPQQQTATPGTKNTQGQKTTLQNHRKTQWKTQRATASDKNTIKSTLVSLRMLTTPRTQKKLR